MSLRTEIARANIYFTAGRIIAAVVGFFFSIILARLLQPYNFGIYSFCLVVSSFFVIFTDLGMTSTLTRFLADYLSRGKMRKASTLIKIIFKYKVILAACIGFLVSVFSSQIAVLFGKPELGFVIVFSGILLMFESTFESCKSLFSGLKNFALVSVFHVLQEALKFVLVIGFVVLGFQVSGALSGLVASYIIAVFLALIVFFKKYHSLIYKKRTTLNSSVLLTFGIWVFLASIVSIVHGLIDRLMISAMLPIENIGFYQIALTWRWAIVYLIPIASYVMYPYFSGARDKKQLNLMFYNSLKYGSLFIFPLTFILSAYSRPLILFLYKEAFLPAAPALSILAFLSIFSVLGNVLISFFISIKRPDITTKIVSVAIILNTALNYFLIQFYGIVGAAIATLISVFFQLAILFLIAIFIQKMTFKSVIILKPLAGSMVAYIVSLYFLPNVTNYFTFAVYGCLSLITYFIVMVLIKGISKQDMVHVKNNLRFF